MQAFLILKQLSFTENNRKYHLRLCTHKENLHNSKLSKRNKSTTKGVFHQRVKYETKKGIVRKHYWRASIIVDGENNFLGTFTYDSAGFEQAKKTYNDVAQKYYGQFAYLNPNSHKRNSKVKIKTSLLFSALAKFW